MWYRTGATSLENHDTDSTIYLREGGGDFIGFYFIIAQSPDNPLKIGKFFTDEKDAITYFERISKRLVSKP